MDQIIFYHVWKEGAATIDFSLWFNTDIKLVIISEEEIFCKQSHIHWATELIKEKDKIYIELPSLYHVPVIIRDFHIPNGYGVMIPVFEFDWVYYIRSNDNMPLVRFTPHEIYIKNQMTNKDHWVNTYVQPSWDFFHENLDKLATPQKRMFLGISKILGEWEMVKKITGECNWDQSIVDFDMAQASYYTSLRLPLHERQQLFWQELRKRSGLHHCIETWWELLDKPMDHDCYHIIQKTCIQESSNDKSPEWCKEMPLYRWVHTKITRQDTLYEKETMLLKSMPPEYNHVRMKHLFTKALHLKESSSHHLFTHECIHYFTKLTTLPECEKGNLMARQDDPDFLPSSAGLIVHPENPRWYIVNVRKVNYRILPNGMYITIKNGQPNTVYNGVSKNEFYIMDRETLKPLSPIRPMSEDGLPGKNEEELAIVGLEDVRLVPSINQDVLFYCTTKNYSYSGAIRIMTGRYDFERAKFHDTKIIHPPYEENACEKNWTWCGHNRFIYQWHPVEIGSVDANARLVVDERIPSPPYFKEFRGSSPAVVWRGFHFFSVHSYTNGKNGRKYIHSIVVLDLLSEKHSVVGVSSPFCFENVQIEYSIGMDIYKGKILFLYSTKDGTSKYARLPLYHVLENMYYTNKEAETLFKTRIYQDLF